MKSQFLFLLLFLLTISFHFYLNAEDIEVAGDETQEQSRNILIAVYHTSFKDSVVSVISETLKRDGYSLTVIDVKDLNSDTIDNFHLTIMITWRRVFRLSSRARKVLKRLKEKDKVIMLVTAKKEEWEYGDREIDAITCASKIENVGEIANVVVKKIRAHFDKEDTSY